MEPSGSSRYEVVRTFKIVGLLQIYVLDYVVNILRVHRWYVEILLWLKVYESLQIIC
jgi:hypothetical protein